ncbi:MAG: PepSY domain-containing protein [Hyphomicrobiaceae bacterium]|nr:PepSY domain-containing protein [Hyphomicrobiaceae bacterium]
MMPFDRRTLIAGIVAAAGLGFWRPPAYADRDRHGREGHDDDHHDDVDHRAAARAREAGEIVSLSEILEHVQRTHPGEIVGVELERKKGRWLYEIKLVSPENRLFEIYVDASDKTIVKIKGK